MKLFEPAALGPLTLKNKFVMAPMTRSRATGNLPNTLMAQYYAQRATAGGFRRRRDSRSKRLPD